MATLDQLKELLESINSRLDIQKPVSPTQIIIVGGLSDISTSLGLVRAGEFRAGTLEEPGFGFSGVRIGYPPFVYNGREWHVAGVKNDVLQVGINSDDGKLYIANGTIIMDENGINIRTGNLEYNQIRFVGSSGAIDSYINGWHYSNTDLLELGVTAGASDYIGMMNLKVKHPTSGEAGISVYSRAYPSIKTGISLTASNLEMNGLLFQNGNPMTGQYEPVLTNSVNIASSTTNTVQWLRINNMVTVSGRLNAVPTAAGVCALTVSLPFATVFSDSGTLGGGGGAIAGADVTTVGLAAYGSTLSSKAVLKWAATSTASHALHFSFTYYIND